MSNTFISNARLKLAKNQAKAKQHSEAAVLLFEFHEFEFRETHMKTPVPESLF